MLFPNHKNKDTRNCKGAFGHLLRGEIAKERDDQGRKALKTRASIGSTHPVWAYQK